MQSAVAVLPRLAREQPTSGSVASAPHAHPSLLAHGQPTRGTPRTRPIPTRHSVCADSCPRFPSQRRPAVLLPLRMHGRPSPGFVASASHPLLPLRTHGRPSPRVVENEPQTASTALRLQTARFQVRRRASGHPYSAGSRYRRGHSTRPGACRPGLGHSTPAGTASPSPNAQDVPGRTEMPPHRRRKRPGRLSPPSLTDQGWAAPIPAALRARRGPPGAPGYGHRPAPARCAGGP